MTKQIPLTRGQFAIVDDEDFEWMSKFKWHCQPKSNGRLYARTGTKKVYMHRVLLNASPDVYVDHIDGNGLNNTRANLRLCTREENQHNTPIRSDSTTGYKGVSFDKRRNRFSVEINKDKKRIRIGNFENVLDAARAYNEAAIKYHGQFARLNEIP